MAKVFPIATDTACLLKWAWSTVYLGQGTTSSCHRTDQIAIDPSNFSNFHNLPKKVHARKLMLSGQWPREGCQYCENIEIAGGMSDRQYQLFAGHDIDRTPQELIDDPTAVEVTPTILEIYFNNTCNMSCLYCGSHFSSKWEEENKKFGRFVKGGVNFGNNPLPNPDYDNMLKDFWKYLEDQERFKKIRYFQILGGEPFFQKEFDQCLEFWDCHPNPDITFNIITNLKVPFNRLEKYINTLESMIYSGKLKNLQITGSIDAWGPQEEYVRWGLDLIEWEKNWQFLVDKQWIVLCINSAISALTIKTLPDLVEKINQWNLKRIQWNPINFSFMSVMTPSQMVPEIFGPNVFEQDFSKVLDLMPESNPSEISAKKHMQGIAQQICTSQKDNARIKDLKIYLDEIDRRRNTNWPSLFPWLVEQ